MQTLKPGKHVAKWAYRTITLEYLQNRVWSYRVDDAPEMHGGNGRALTPEEAIRRAAEYLMTNGCYAVLNGMQRSLADFLVFEEVTDAGT